jgi:hypothetical protein
VRKNTSPEKLLRLKQVSAGIVEVDFNDEVELARACEGASVVVSAVAGLREVVVDLQTRILRAAISAGVPRFIPSDFALDYRSIPPGDNRNLNLREEFRNILERSSEIRATSILNGAFMDMLTGAAPFILFPLRRILCWGDPDQRMDWTTIDDTARTTAYAALDGEAPRFIRIAGDESSARDIARTMTEIAGKPYGILRPGSPSTLKTIIKITKFLSPGGDSLYPAWQGMQYMHNLYSGLCKHPALDNDRYPVQFTSIRDLMSKFYAGEIGRYTLPS